MGDGRPALRSTRGQAAVRVGSLWAILVTASCAYSADRARDFRDIFTLAAETGHVGASAQVLFLPIAVSFEDGDGYGLRSGHAGHYDNEGIHWLVAGTRRMRATGDERNKSFEMSYEYDRPLEQSGGWWTHFQVEAAAGLWLGTRAGVNLGEALDFVLGWFTVDLCGDDLGRVPESPEDDPSPTLSGSVTATHPMRRNGQVTSSVNKREP